MEISSNRESRNHGEKITLSVGGLVQVSELKKDSDAKARAVLDRGTALWEKTHKLVMERLQAAHPEIPDNFVFNNGLVQPVDDWYAAEKAAVLAEHPEFLDEREQLEKEYAEARKRTYDFTRKDRDKDDLYVGKEGTLVYSEVDGGSVADEIIHERKRAEACLRDKSGNVRANYRELEAMPPMSEIEKIVETFKRAGKVIDIHQVEVLPAAQGKGVASALLDVAHWDIDAQKRADVAVARVLEDNPDGRKMLAMFEKHGYNRLYMPGDGDRTPNYYLVFKEFTQH